MASNPFESQWIYGLHDPGGEQIMLAANKPGWVVFTEGVGHDPRNRSGSDYRSYSNRGLGVICRLNNGYHPQGTLPLSRNYADFAQRCANFVAASQGCRIWIVGNEANYEIERPSLSQQSSTAPSAPTAPAASSRDAEQPNTAKEGDLWGRFMTWLRRWQTGAPKASAPRGTKSEAKTTPPA